jgi:hypothetical protein
MASVGDRCVEHPVDHAPIQNIPVVSAINRCRVNMDCCDPFRQYDAARNHQQTDYIVNLNGGSMTPVRTVFSSPSASARCLLLTPPPALL